MGQSIPGLLFKSITLAGANATISPGALQPWLDEIEQTVAEQGKYSKQSVAYLPFSPPPALWDYKCKKCRAWQPPAGCKWVEGKIAPIGWCTIWLPPDDYKALSWPKELLSGDW